MEMRAIGKLLAHRTGAMRAYHFRRNSATLTVLMFHRVLPEEELARVGADPLYTVTPRFLSDCVAFLRGHYAIVGLKEVLDAQARVKPLPRRAVLITFDDGWYDNLLHALPTLAGTPWTLFAAANALLEPDCWWQETLLWNIRSGNANFCQMWHAANGAVTSGITPEKTSGIYSLLLRYAGLSPDKRAAALAPYEDKLRRELCGRPHGNTTIESWGRPGLRNIASCFPATPCKLSQNPDSQPVCFLGPVRWHGSHLGLGSR
jgi:hypothetical protein